jgi:ABC-2 type transport system ATP-binding protein
VSLVELHHVTKRYATAHGPIAVLDGLDLTVERGEVLGLIGPNGGGKSTTLLLMAGLIRPDAGDVRVDGAPAHRVALDRSGTVGLITAVPGLYPLLSGWENLFFFGSLYGLPPEETRRRVHDLARDLGILDRLSARTATFSSGMQQKVSLLRALLMDPALLLLDEPTSNLDPFAARTILEAARAHADRGRAVVWVTHDLTAAEAVCDRAVLVRQRVLHTERFDGPRALATEGRLAAAWRAAGVAP